MKGSTAGDGFEGLGRKVDKKPADPPPQQARAPAPPAGIKVGPDGKWQTDIPPPKNP